MTKANNPLSCCKPLHKLNQSQLLCDFVWCLLLHHLLFSIGVLLQFLMLHYFQYNWTVWCRNTCPEQASSLVYQTILQYLFNCCLIIHWKLCVSTNTGNSYLLLHKGWCYLRHCPSLKCLNLFHCSIKWWFENISQSSNLLMECFFRNFALYILSACDNAMP